MPYRDIPVRRYAAIDSTNLEARRLVAAGEQGPLWLVAGEQTAGLGRLGRHWESKAGNLYSTLLLPLDVPIALVPQLGFVVALAVHDTVHHHAPAVQPQLKWPNDCLVDGAKIAGILCEVLQQSPVVVALGCGINVATAPKGLTYPATSLRACDAAADAEAVFVTYERCVQYWLGIWNKGAGFATIREAWQQRAIGVGEVVEFRTGTDIVTATMTGIDAQGALVLQHGGKVETFHAGDLSIPSLVRQRAAQ